MPSKVSDWHRRQAMQLAVQLPEKREDAVKIVGCMVRLIRFLYGPIPPSTTGNGRQGVVPFRSVSPNRRASSSGSATGLPK
jgi:hypothetical protein